MSFRELTMIEVREVVRRWKAQQGLREVARETGLDRKTVRRYVEAIEGLGVGRDVELDDALVHQVASRVQTRAVPEPKLAIAGEERASESGKLRTLPNATPPRFARSAERFTTRKEGER